MKIVDPGFRPRLMLEDAQALELVTRAADAAAAGSGAGVGAGPGEGAAAASATAVAVPLDPALAKLFQHHSDGDTIASVQVAHVQRLWGGMGAVLEVRAVTGSGVSALLIVKKILLPGGVLSLADQRKKASYECECEFFGALAGELRSAAGCSVPAGLLVDQSTSIINIVMSKMPGSPTLSAEPEGDADAAAKLAFQYKEYGQKVYSSESDEPDANDASLSPSRTAAAIDFLASMHGHTWGSARADSAVARGIQPQGGYWYLDTRPEEWEKMPTRGWEGRLRRAARAIDRRLKEDIHQCVIHGDTKPDNMCFTTAGVVSMCDFQYCGRASPMKDLAYLLCCAADAGCSPTSTEAHLARYHERLSAALTGRGAGAEIPPLAELKTALDLAFADLCRWMSGWGYWGDVPNLQSLVQGVLERIDGGQEDLGSEEAYEEAVRRAFPLPGAEAAPKRVKR